jgi:phosphodiesterase/alkaline phosphatase D-like protein
MRLLLFWKRELQKFKNILQILLVQTTGPSGVQKSFIVSGLTPESSYSFQVTTTDASGNTAANTVNLPNVTTIADPSTACAGQTVDYAYTFETLTSGTDVKVTFELLNAVTGLVTPSFSNETAI